MKVMDELYATILDRKENPEEGSYTCYLFEKGKEKILKKVGEECTEMIIACMKDDSDETIAEMSDFLYHLNVLMVNQGITWEQILDELKKRSFKEHNKKAERKPVTEY